jgi:TolA-binding protein
MQRDGRAKQALDLYLLLDREHPNEPVIRLGIASAALEAGDLGQARRVVDEAIATQPPDPDWIRLRGKVLMAEGKPAEAVAAWRELLTVFPDREEAYRTTGMLLASEKKISEAVALLEEGRAALGDSLLFHTELAALYDMIGRSGSALAEYVRGVAAGRIDAAEATFRSGDLNVSAEEAADLAALAATLAPATPAAAAELSSFLAHLWLLAGECAAARAAAGQADAQSGGCGERRLAFAERIADGPCAAEGIEALREVTATCPPSPVVWHARRTLAKRLVEAGGFGEARDQLASLIAEAPEGSPEHAEGLLELADVQLVGTREPAAARASFERFVSRYPGGQTAWSARLGAARAALLAGDFAAAEPAFAGLVDRGPDDDVREAGLFFLAELNFYRGDFDKSLELYAKLLKTYPAGTYLNDAVDRLVFVEASRDAGDGLLREFADAARSGQAGDAAGAEARFRTLASDFPLSALRDEAMFEAAMLADRLGRHEAALADLDLLVESFSESPLAPRALLEKGRIRARKLADAAGARAEWERLLVDYPKSLLVDEARAHLGELDARAASGTRG